MSEDKNNDINVEDENVSGGCYRICERPPPECGKDWSKHQLKHWGNEKPIEYLDKEKKLENNEMNIENISGGAGTNWKLKDRSSSTKKKELPPLEVKNGVKLYRLGKNGILKVKSRESYESW